jgi:5-methyltetrahydrofolate--homocysteine methyltransferase
MPSQGSSFIIIGENIHCTRKVKRGGKRARTLPDGTEVVVYQQPDGGEAHMPVPESIQKGQTFANGMIPHVAAAVELGLSDNPAEQAIGRDYVTWLARRQVDRGAAFLDINVDEVSTDPERRNQAMQWIVPVVQGACDKPLSIDSSELATLEAGLEAYDEGTGKGPAMLNSASLERPAAVELAARHKASTIVLASGKADMPADADQRMANIEGMAAICRQAGLAMSQLYIDPLVLPASASPEAPPHVLEAIRRIRAEYGGEVHITGGHSNVSFGLPMRRLLNAVWIALAIEAGVDSGIIDPITSHPDDIARLDRDSQTFKMARAGFEGKDLYFMEFIEASRAGKLEDPFAAR